MFQFTAVMAFLSIGSGALCSVSHYRDWKGMTYNEKMRRERSGKRSGKGALQAPVK